MGGAEAEPVRGRGWPAWRIGLAVAWVGALVSVTLAWGFPASRDKVVIFVLTGLVIMVAGRRRGVGRLVLDFLPVLLFLYAYDLLRGQAGGFVGHVFTEPQLRADEWLFGGTIPTITLQRALWNPAHPQIWNYGAFLVYSTYVLVPFGVAAILWRKGSDLFHRYVALWIGLSFTALLTYALYPATPPWLAAKEGFLPHVTRITPRMSKDIGVDLTRVMGAHTYVNQVAAVPSLHAGVALLISLFFWSRTKRWRWLLVLYPLAMAFSLVYFGEHYFSDIALGWLYAVVAFIVGNRLYDLFADRRSTRRRSDEGGAETESSAVAVTAAQPPEAGVVGEERKR